MLITEPGIWVQWWAKAKHPDRDLDHWLGIYGFLGIMAIFFIIASCWYEYLGNYNKLVSRLMNYRHLMANMVAVAARTLHLKLLTTVQK